MIKLEESGYFVLYTDTDSIACCVVDPKAPPLQDILHVGPKLGAYKVEEDDVRKYIFPFFYYYSTWFLEEKKQLS